MNSLSGKCRAVRRLLPVVVAIAAAAASGPPAAQAATPAAFCTRIGTDDTLRPIPESLVPSVNRAFGTALPPRVAIDTTVFRCSGGHVLVCTTGANLPCGPANTSRTPGRGEVAWCRDHPDAAFIPAFATGHDTIFAWRCRDHMPEVDRQVQEVDPRGFIATYWKLLP
ncbi:MAG TPA: hypothetical protein VMB34_24995 [Acetobacteraceae bacterium]|nr:hypothetical protein [Acetobacteraceae bacterium]